jgi:hypothetical protein
MVLEYHPKANATWVDQKQDGEINSIFKISFFTVQDARVLPLFAFVIDDDDD